MNEIFLNASLNSSNTVLLLAWETTIKKALPSVAMACVSLMAIVGNLIVIIAMIREKNLRTVKLFFSNVTHFLSNLLKIKNNLNFLIFFKISNTFILSLSISDLMIGLFVMPLSASIVILDRWIWGKHICKATLTFITFLIC